MIFSRGFFWQAVSASSGGEKIKALQREGSCGEASRGELEEQNGGDTVGQQPGTTQSLSGTIPLSGDERVYDGSPVHVNSGNASVTSGN